MAEKLSDAIASNDEYRILLATRDLVAERLEQSQSGRDTAALSKQMQELTEKLAELERKRGSKKKQSALDKARKMAANG